MSGVKKARPRAATTKASKKATTRPSKKATTKAKPPRRAGKAVPKAAGRSTGRTRSSAPATTRKTKPAPKTKVKVRPKAKVKVKAARKPVRAVERTIVRIRDLDPYRKCGPGTSVERLIRVDEMVDRRLEAHLVFFDRHGWYCEHGQGCHAVGHARRHASHVEQPAW